MKKILFIDRDGTLIREPETDYQVDRLSKFSFLPEVMTYLGKIVRELDYMLVMVTNQDGLGTDSYPEGDFWPLQELMVDTLKGEGIRFDGIHIDRSFEKDQSLYRKPGTGMLKAYMDGSYNLAESFVLGDRWSDITLAQNLGAQGIFLHELQGKSTVSPLELTDVVALQSNSWKEIYGFLKKLDRTSKVIRNTNETKIQVGINLDGSGVANIDTGLNFFNHMLEQIAKHGGIDLVVRTDGDLEIDEHHTIEDTAIGLGQVFKQAIGKKVGIQRYGFCLPMDDVLAQVALDFGGRAWIEWDVAFKREYVGDMPTELVYHFFKSFSDQADCNLNIKAEGDNEHHKIEGIFKAFAKAIKMAVQRDVNSDVLPSTKGIL
ncbi:MAG: imidazoleglycerol-phosphate dehydratase/histidinol-phosphatase [Saprospiraceae bacterium]|jgi:imidazoleglycerol-phosphate dehydratase/histidinol-phosphatase